jgi:hypothetical protein
MRFSRVLAVVAVLFIVASAALGADADWRLAWQDDFQRTELGDGWQASNRGASVVDGHLRLEGCVWVMTTRGFAPDVRLEFDASVLPGVTPCDMSATLASSPEFGWGYLLGFGARGNRANHMLGPGVHFVDEHPPFLLEHGKHYHLVAQKEGKHISYTVNGTTIMDVTTDDPLGGPNFDRVGIITWTGIIVDNVKVYERVTPHPDTPKPLGALPPGPLYRDGRTIKIREDRTADPALGPAVDAFNKRQLEDALQRFEKMGATLPGLLGQAYVLGDLDYYEPYHNPEFDRLAAEFKAAAAAHPGDQALADYSLAAGWFATLKMQRGSSALASTLRLRALGTDNNPFYYKARLYEARYHYWDGKEGGNGAVISEAVGWMKELKDLWPDNIILREYTGDKVPWGQELTADTDHNPAWAAYLREAYARDVAIMEHFIAERQTPDGQFGGGYGDDCEMMRTWMQIAAISSAASQAQAGIERLAQGIWDNCLIKGFNNGLADVEHSAEPSADTLPTMMFLRYGDPLWVERNQRSCKTIKDYYMGIDANGYPRFRSSGYGGLQVDTSLMGGGDTGYNARTMKHFLWAAWRGDPEARDWFVRWADGWRAATMKRIGSKLAGIVPPTLWYPNGGIFPPVEGRPWWDEKLNYCTRGDMIHDVFLAAYCFTHDRKFLEPFQWTMDQATRGPMLKGDSPEGSEDWQLEGLPHFPFNMPTEQNKVALYRWLTGDTVYDEYTFRFGDPTIVYRVTGDLDTYLKSFEGAAKGIRNNLELQTTEVLSTDRTGLGAPLSVFGAYTGAVANLRDAATPTFAVTYDTPTTDFAALVTDASDERLRVWLYNFDDDPMPVGLKLWRLRPGHYILNQGEQLPGEVPQQHRYGWLAPRRVDVLRRAEGPTVMVPPRKVWVVDLRLEQPIYVFDTACDLAIGTGDVTRTSDGIKVTVHNIGNDVAQPFTVALQEKAGDDWRTVAEKTVAALPAPKDFEPSRTTITFAMEQTEVHHDYRVVVDPDDQQFELCEANNNASVISDLDRLRREIELRF